MFREGLISANLLTEQEQQYNEHRVNGDFGAFVAAFYDVDNNVNKVLNENNKDFQYTDVGPIDKTPRSFKFAAIRTKGDFAWMVNSKIKDPSVPAKWLAYMLSDEGQEHALGGIKDKDFTVDGNGRYRLSEENTVKLNENLEKYCQANSVVAKFIPWVDLAKWSYFIEEPMLKGGAKKIYELRYPQDRIIDLWGDGFADLDSAIPLSSDVGVSMIKCKEAMENTAVKLVSAGSDAEFKEIYDKSLKDLEIMGVAKYEKAINEEHQKQLKALGK